MTRPRAGGNAHRLWPIAEISRRLDVVATLRGRDDFARLVELTKRVDNILVKTPAEGVEAAGEASAHPSEAALRAAHADLAPRIEGASGEGRFEAVADLVAAYAAPVSTFFDDVLVLDPADPAATARRCALLARVRDAITRDFDIRELAGQADRRS